ncbi:nuclear transport factor 2 family protein [Chryseobacterium tructae]|uniref:Nuclear transport factor 2 family protein n=1 Tax=Chryseobacterium tructae TaxID=1037380 RepID=A0ABV7XUL0_9FLAO|nr:nuclear transport factor 2 family protein [Chryseobacterium tructae]MDN3692404.1 nuclear transport factor 2 family protein [Chryseobacterium tructae]
METQTTQQKNIQVISHLLENIYFKGIFEGDTTLLSTIYNPTTLLFGDVKGQPYAKNLKDYLDGVKNRQSPKDSGKPFKGEILSVKVVNSIAYAEVKVTMYDFIYQEFLSFHSIDGRWLLVNKMISDIADETAENLKKKQNPKTSLIATMTILPGFENQVKKALNTMEVESNKELGCQLFVVTLQKDSPQKVIVYESYDDDEAFEQHKNRTYSRDFFELVKGKIADDKIEVVYLTELAPVL